MFQSKEIPKQMPDHTKLQGMKYKCAKICFTSSTCILRKLFFLCHLKLEAMLRDAELGQGFLPVCSVL